ncbi:unnamed protein product [Hydatigera taeniaeformis]|uniref:MFS domain-containing protein n=1 Tax=Hydatigena taeniaeformis TaxID=6205 RepID=A0A0R3X4S8_HYDTA|nr:unnamed protein product [Hydatigera taeniaeformis]
MQTYIEVTGSDTEQLGTCLSMRELGMFFGSLMGAFLADRFVKRRHFVVAGSLILGATTIGAVPWCRTVASLSATFFFSGYAHGAMTAILSMVQGESANFRPPLEVIADKVQSLLRSRLITLYYIGTLIFNFTVVLNFTALANTGGNPLLNSIWLEKSGGPFNFMHSGYGVGAAVAPGLLAPFTFAMEKTLANGTVVQNKIISLTVPYFIVGGLCCVCACLFCCFSLCKSAKEDLNCGVDDFVLLLRRFFRLLTMMIFIKETSESTTAKSEDSDSSEEFKDTKAEAKKSALLQALAAQQRVLLYIIVPLFLLYAALVGNERVFSKYLFVFANEGPAHLPESDCFLLNSVYWIVFALARVITVPVSLVVPLPILFAIQLIGAWAMALGLYLAPANRTIYLAFTACFGLFKSPLFPTGLGVVSLATPVTGIIIFFVNLGSSVGASVLQAVGGMVLNRQGRQAFPLLVMISALTLVFIGAGLISATYFYRKRHHPNLTPSTNLSI